MSEGKYQRVPRLLRDSLGEPTGKQKEAYGRWLHTLSAAAVIGAVTIAFSRAPTSTPWYDGVKVLVLVVIGAVLFLIGGILSKGE